MRIRAISVTMLALAYPWPLHSVESVFNVNFTLANVRARGGTRGRVDTLAAAVRASFACSPSAGVGAFYLRTTATGTGDARAEAWVWDSRSGCSRGRIR